MAFVYDSGIWRSPSPQRNLVTVADDIGLAFYLFAVVLLTSARVILRFALHHFAVRLCCCYRRSITSRTVLVSVNLVGADISLFASGPGAPSSIHCWRYLLYGRIDRILTIFRVTVGHLFLRSANM